MYCDLRLTSFQSFMCEVQLNSTITTCRNRKNLYKQAVRIKLFKISRQMKVHIVNWVVCLYAVSSFCGELKSTYFPSSINKPV